ncbi:endonuclease MutS2 [Geobacter sp. AOG1]|uniref:endonuclease MutS2 n=1 Tax=Geobacter sp. AOG1 TaxID=1566346 RepID=UPI001CC7482D|nr:endonuclease MutS2 [Geobacter sp. AOG1]GFE56138.1 endonuclease MutS2 [Geobacter sp. AOG1]
MITTETLRTLEFLRIVRLIADFAHSDATGEEIARLAPLADRGEICTRFARIEEIRRLGQLGITLPFATFADIRPVLAQVRPAGAVLDPRDLALLMPILRIMTAIAKQFAYRTDIPRLQELAGHITGFPDLLESLERSIDSEGAILDTASRLLHDLRGRKRGLTQRIRRRLEEIVRERQTAIFLQDDFITQRNGRWVIPVRMDSKGMVPGVVHDVSNSGETAFMEPLEIIGLANELENLVAEEKVEEIRILRELCRWLREETEALAAQFASLVALDLLNSIARFADLVQGEVPQLGNTGLRLVGARHPLLLLQARESGRAVVPLDLDLGSEISGETPSRVMVITGPNAGGKTIAIKTAGLLLLMTLTGIPVPAAATSVFPLASQLLVDIGDEQSIEASLSTFSSHVNRIAGIVRKADSRTVVLLDELGTGTEPLQGAAIACAVLKELQEQGALVLATTHLTDIVGFVHQRKGMVNAAMEFDRQTFTPLYKLKSGEPGQSHALEIARRYGLPDRLIDFAQGLLGRMESEFHALLGELQEQRNRQDLLLAEQERHNRDLAAREAQLKERLAVAEREKRESMEKAHREAKDIIQAARREVNAILDEARREKSKVARQKVAELEEQAEARLREFHPEEELAPDKVAVGGTVYVRSLGYDAQVVALDRARGRLRVRAGSLEIEVPLDGIAPPRGKAAKALVKGKRPAPEEEAPTTEINLVGSRVDDALPRLEQFLNHASLAGYVEIRVVHGKGTGALMRGVRQFLDGHPLVRELREGEPYEGGSGVTVVTLR